jgi:V-type H+-transporting ATPase subunit C
MSKTIAIVGVKSSGGSGSRQIQTALPAWVKIFDIQLERDKFKLGSLDTMLQGLDRINKCENISENFLKRIEKIFGELVPEKSLFSFNIEAKDKGQIPIIKFVQNFSWDDIRYPRSSALNDQIRNLEEKLDSMEKNIRLKQLNYQDSKTNISNSFDRKETTNSFLNSDLNETIYDLIKNKKVSNPENIFIKSNYLQSLIVFVPKASIEAFLARYENEAEFVVPDSFVNLSEQFDYVMGHIVGYKRGFEDIKSSYKSNFGALVREYNMDLEWAKTREQDKKKAVDQNKTDKEQLESTAIESFKELVVMICHIKVYKTIIDSNLRFGSFNNFNISILFFDKGKDSRIINDLVTAFAEKDKLEFYGTKEQLNDTEDFFPFVFSTYSFSL